MYIIVTLTAKVKKTGTFLGVPGKMNCISTVQELTVYRSPANKIIMANITAQPGCPTMINSTTPSQAMLGTNLHARHSCHVLPTKCKALTQLSNLDCHT